MQQNALFAALQPDQQDQVLAIWITLRLIYYAYKCYIIINDHKFLHTVSRYLHIFISF